MPNAPTATKPKTARARIDAVAAQHGWIITVPEPAEPDRVNYRLDGTPIFIWVVYDRRGRVLHRDGQRSSGNRGQLKFDATDQAGQIISYLKKLSANHTAANSDAPETAGTLTDERADADFQAIRAAMIEHTDALDALYARAYKIVYYFYEHGHSMQDIAHRTQLRKPTVQRILEGASIRFNPRPQS